MTLQTIRDYFNFFENKVLPELKKTARQELEGYHGLETHTYQVVFRAVDYALKLNQNPMPVFLRRLCMTARVLMINLTLNMG